MKGLRSFVGLLAILLALGGYLYFVESKREAESEDGKEKVFSVEADKIDELTVKSESGDQTTLKKTGTDWQIVQPAAFQPDSAEVSNITTNLASLERQRVIDENPADIDEYGLAKPRIEIGVKSAGQEKKLLIGRKTPPGTDLYAKLADSPRVFLISSFLDSTFNKTTFDLRDKTVLKLDRDKIDALTITVPAHTVRVAKRDGEWRLAAPLDARADFTTVDGLVSRINGVQMKSIASAEPAGLAEYGLDKPAATLVVGSGSSQATLLVGTQAGQGLVFAKDQARPMVMRLDSSFLDELKKEPTDFRQKDLFDARAFTATGLEIVRKGQTIAFEKTKVKNKEGQEEEKWRQTAPSAQDVDQPRIDSLLSAVTQSRAASFVNSTESTAKTGLDTPELTVTVKSGQGRQETVRFAKAGSDSFASRTGEPGAAKLDANTIDNITRALDEVQKPAGKDSGSD